MSRVPKLVESMSASTARAPISAAPVSSAEKKSMRLSLVQALSGRIGRSAEKAIHPSDDTRRAPAC
jgi:hypothetical protein